MSWLNPTPTAQAQPLATQAGDDFGNTTFLRPSDSSYSKISKSSALQSSSSSTSQSFAPQQPIQPPPASQQSFFSRSQSQPIQQTQQVPIQPQTPQPPGKKLFKATLYFFDVFFSVLVSATAALGIGSAKSVNDASMIFVSLYLILFCAILVFQDFFGICKIKFLDDLFIKNFGFLYGPIGKGCYFLFIGLLVFGLSSSAIAQLVTASGVLCVLYGLAYIVLALTLPLYFDKREKYVVS